MGDPGGGGGKKSAQEGLSKTSHTKKGREPSRKGLRGTKKNWGKRRGGGARHKEGNIDLGRKSASPGKAQTKGFHRIRKKKARWKEESKSKPLGKSGRGGELKKKEKN